METKHICDSVNVDVDVNDARGCDDDEDDDKDDDEDDDDDDNDDDDR